MQQHVGRTLTFIDDRGKQQRIHERDLPAMHKPVIVLGEPGMGKTWLLRRLAGLPGHVFRSAASFVAHPNPAALVPSGARLVIDGLDELSAAQESDPVYRVLGQLIAAGCPPFVLSCRSADWRGAVARQDISDEYNLSPQQMWLEPFSRESAIEYLQPALGAPRAIELIEYLDEKAIPDLYGNPLTLSLFAEVGAQGGNLPASRADLLLRASQLMWREANDRHDKSSLSALDQETALAAAGATSAAFILTGSEAITLKPSNAAIPRAVHVPELRSLPGGEHARTLLGSRLFTAIPETNDQFTPIHRTLAEYLGANWLARSVTDDQACERTLAMMTIDSGVPASLRGIHAWLVRDERFAAKVIETDPYGVLRYGDADGLSVDEGRLLLKSLKSLQQINPYFRAQDWSAHTAKGLTHIELLDDVREILVSEKTTFHLRTLLLGIIGGTALATALSSDLQRIVLDEGEQPFTYAERHDAAHAIMHLNGHGVDLNAIVEKLVRVGDENSTRLALDVMQEIAFESFGPDQIVRAVLAHLGLLDAAAVDRSERPITTSLYFTARQIPDVKVAAVLDALAAKLPRRDPAGDLDSSYEVSNLVAHLITRQIEIDHPQPLALLNWLRITSREHGSADDDQRRIADFIHQAHDVRHAIQHYVLFSETDVTPIWNRIWLLGEIKDALALSADDVIHFLGVLDRKSSPSLEDIAIWRELARLSRSFADRAGDILRAAGTFAVANNSELQAHLEEMANPPSPPSWKVKETERRRERARRLRNGLGIVRTSWSTRKRCAPGSWGGCILLRRPISVCSATWTKHCRRWTASGNGSGPNSSRQHLLASMPF